MRFGGGDAFCPRERRTWRCWRAGCDRGALGRDGSPCHSRVRAPLAGGPLRHAIVLHAEVSAEMFSFQHCNCNTFHRELFYVSVKKIKAVLVLREAVSVMESTALGCRSSGQSRVGSAKCALVSGSQ